MPVQLYLKYARSDVVIGRENGYIMSTFGKVYNGMLIGLVLASILLCFIFLFVSVLVIAHHGLDESFAGWSIYLFCWFVILIGVFAISANFVSSRYEMDFDHLETIEQPINETDASLT